jgi:hypothetical protein
MPIPVRRSFLGLVALIVLPAVGAAQKRPVEFGLDAGVMFGLTEPKSTIFSLPIQSFRVGFFASDQLSFEPALTFNYIKPQDADALTQIGGTLSVLYHFSADVEKSRWYARPILGVEHVSSGGDGTTQFLAGAGMGVTERVANRLAIRLEARYTHGFEKAGEVAASDALGLLVGLSFFTR